MSTRKLVLMVALSLSLAAHGMASQIGDTPELSRDQVNVLREGFTEAGGDCTAPAATDKPNTNFGHCVAQTEQCGGVRAVFESGAREFRVHFQFRGSNGRWHYGPRALTLTTSEELGLLALEGSGISLAASTLSASMGLGSLVPLSEMGAELAATERGSIILFGGTTLGLASSLSEYAMGLVWLGLPGADMYRGAAAARPWTAIGRERQGCIADYLMGVSRLAQTVSTGGTPTYSDYVQATYAAGVRPSPAPTPVPADDGAPAAGSAGD
jgi:hypothetical protein